MPVGDLDAELASRLHALLEAEIAAIVDDWQAKRPWFVSSDNAVTNQWVLPTEGLVRACLLVGREGHRDAYELGVRNLLRALDAHGAQGEFEEGFGYAGFTVTSLAHAAFAMAIQGDRRAIDHPFLKHFPTWYIHHLQPGNMVINCFDAGGAYDKAATMRPLLSLLAVCTADPTCLWGLEQVGGPSDDLAGLAARGIPPDAPRTAPPRFAQYERATRVNWRSGWQDNASGVWVRGGHPLDQHDHQDRGHVNFILHGRPVFIEAGTPAYHHPRMMTQYTPGVGHNVLQIGTAMPEGQANAGEDVWLTGWQKRGGIAPITVKRLDEAGGEVILDASACYDGLDRWTRNVDWQEDGIRVTDRVALAAGTDNIILFRWHLGTESPVSISGEGTGWVTDCSCARIHIEADRSIVVTQIAMPDHTLAGHTGEDLPANTHTCLVVQSAGREPALALTTTVE
ncbi:MAG: heparinase II/III family protein [Candidatus Hydrogenedentes bacterium]|nr:heparinase II/III family protein [Candidatus Hydrogenedentota bacterium]